MTETVAAVIPAYNIAPFVEEAVRSVLVQSHADVRAIVVDDGSSDGTAEVVAGSDDPRVTLIAQANAGVSVARNTGFAASDADYVMFLDGDDLLHPTAIERLVKGLVANPKAVAAFGTFRKILPSGADYPGQKPLGRHVYPNGDVLRAMLLGNFLANGGHVLIRRTAVEAIGGFSPALRLSEDWEFWCRLAAEGEFAFIGTEPEVFSLRVRPGSSSGGLSVDWANHLPCLEAIAGNARISGRFSTAEWARIKKAMWAAQMWEAGRVNFTMRRFKEARRLMLGALRLRAEPKRLALFGLAQASQLLNRPLASRLRFRDLDIADDR